MVLLSVLLFLVFYTPVKMKNKMKNNNKNVVPLLFCYVSTVVCVGNKKKDDADVDAAWSYSAIHMTLRIHSIDKT
jgi:hypothetical protein